MQFFEAASRGRPASTIQRLGVGLPRPRESESVRHHVLDFLILHCQQFFNPKLQIMRSENLGFRFTLPAVFFPPKVRDYAVRKIRIQSRSTFSAKIYRLCRREIGCHAFSVFSVSTLRIIRNPEVWAPFWLLSCAGNTPATTLCGYQCGP